MFKLNLHAHSTYSDGRNTIHEMVQEYKKQDFTVAVITDHVYSTEHAFSLNLEKFKAALIEAEEVSQKLDFPIILGAEFSFAAMEEIVIIGEDAILYLLRKRRDRLNSGESGELSLEDVREVVDKFNPFIFLCHPQLTSLMDGYIPFFGIGSHEILTGYEKINHGQVRFKPGLRELPDELKGKVALSNSDAHGISHLNYNYNLTASPITTEKELLDYVASGGKFLLYNSWGREIN